MTGIIRHILTIHIHKLILILDVPICFQKTTKNTKATFIFKSLKGSYLQKPLWFTSTISGGQSNSSHFYLHHIKWEVMQHVFASLFACAVFPLHAVSQPPIPYKWGRVRGKVEWMKYCEEKEVYNREVSGEINL